MQSLVEGGTGDYEYEWTSNPPGFSSSWSSPTDTPSETTTYFVEVSDGMQIVQDSVQVVVNPLPEIILEDWPEDLCNEDEDPVQLESSPSGGTYSGENVTETGLFDPDGIEAGWYLVTYTFTDGNGCTNSATDSIFVHDCVGFGETPSADHLIKIYPVPNSGNFTVESAGIIKEIEIINSLGVVVYSVKASSQKVGINRQLSKGIYLIKILVNASSGSQIVYKSIVIRK